MMVGNHFIINPDRKKTYIRWDQNQLLWVSYRYASTVDVWGTEGWKVVGYYHTWEGAMNAL
jgi:hypothetical protein